MREEISVATDLMPHEKRELEKLNEYERQKMHEWQPPRTSKHLPDHVAKPKHYIRNGVECIDTIRAMLGTEGAIHYAQGNIAKYNHRLMHKGDPLENAQKMLKYTQFLVEDLERKAKETP